MIQPGTHGPLSLDYASSLEFGENNITTEDQTYEASAIPFTDAENTDKENPGYTSPYAQVTDIRGTNAGWTLTVAQQAQLKSGSLSLDGALINLTDGVVVAKDGNVAPKPTNVATEINLTPDASSQPVMAANAGEGAGTWMWEAGNKDNIKIDNTVGGKADKGGKPGKRASTSSVTLMVPGGAQKSSDAAGYSADLLWTLSAAPSNGGDNGGTGN